MKQQSLIQKVEWLLKDTDAITNDGSGNLADAKPWKNYYSFNGEFEEIWPFTPENKLLKTNDFKKNEYWYKHTLLSKIMEGIAMNK